MSKVVLKGWASKNCELPCFNSGCLTVDDMDIFARKGERDTWDYDDWPPVPVTVTVEINDEGKAKQQLAERGHAS